MFVSLGIHVAGRPQFFFSPLQGVLDGMFVDLFFADCPFGQNVNPVAFDLNEPAADREPQGLAVFVTRNSPCSTWVSRGMWPGRMPISPSAVGMTTVSIVSE